MTTLPADERLRAGGLRKRARRRSGRNIPPAKRRSNRGGAPRGPRRCDPWKSLRSPARRVRSGSASSPGRRNQAAHNARRSFPFAGFSPQSDAFTTVRSERRSTGEPRPKSKIGATPPLTRIATDPLSPAADESPTRKPGGLPRSPWPSGALQRSRQEPSNPSTAASRQTRRSR